MKYQIIIQRTVLAALLAIWPQSKLAAQGTAFAYQGRLNFNGSPASGTYDLQFRLYDAVTTGNPVGGALAYATTPVNAGLFSVNLDFGAATFDGSARWLDIGVRTNGSPTNYTALIPRQP